MTTAKNQQNLLEKVLDHPLGRRRFVQVGGALAGTAAAAGAMLRASDAQALNDPGVPDDVESASGVDVRYSVCLGCHSKCGTKVRVQSDTIIKIDGNPWHPNNAETGERLDFAATLDAARDSTVGTLCPKGQAGVEVMYNPFRINQPLKRVGARGSGQWREISWDTALTEIADRLRPYYDGHAAGTNIPTRDGSGALGTIANQVIFSPGRFQHGQKEFTDRMFKGGFGTVNNRHDHTSICETSHHVSGAFMTERFLPSQKDVKHHFKPEMENSDYILWFGTNPLEANFPGQTLAKRVAKSRNAGTRHVIIDPRHSRAAAFAHRWLPVVPGHDIALANGIARRIIAAGNHNVAALEAANYLAARALTPTQYEATDATYLVVVKAPSTSEEMLFHRMGTDFTIVDKTSGNVTALSRGETAAARTGRIELTGSETGAVTAASAGLSASVVGDYVIDLGGGRYASTVWQLYKARIMSMTLDQYASACGIDAATITAVADEFAAAAPACNANAYRGPCQHHNGVAAVQAIMALNALVMNYEHRGGTIGGTGGHLHEMGGTVAGQLSLGSEFGTTKRSTAGPQITRVKSFFTPTLAAALGESTSAPTRRPWFPFAYNGNYQELIPSIEDQYPYPAKVLISLWNNIPYSTPAAREACYRVLTDETKIPVHVCFDIEMSEMATLADYVLPDGSYHERWSTPHNSPVILSKYSCFRSPVVGYYATKVGTNGRTYWESLAMNDLHNWNYTIDWATETGPFTAEDILMELMRRVAGGSLNSFAGFGDNAYYASTSAMTGDGVSASMTNSLNTAWDWYWNMLVNFAIEAGVAPGDATAINAMIHQIVARGGWFQDTPGDRSNEYNGNYVKNRFKAAAKGKAVHIFHEYSDGAGNRYLDPFSLLHYDPLPAVTEVLDAKGNVVDDGPEFAFKVATYKPMYHSQGRTDSLPSLTRLEPENFVEMNTADARRLGLCNGDFVKVSSATNRRGVRGRLKLTERVRPGVIAISHSRGRWEINSRPYRVDGALTAWDPRRGRGLNSNPIMRTDPNLPNVTLQDPIGGSSSFYDTNVKVERASF
jgi:anaerobic selenocysteine-containing dehydrogenase